MMLKSQRQHERKQQEGNRPPRQEQNGAAGKELLAKSGWPAGGRAYGYTPASQSGTGQIEINQPQAETVRRIFEWRAAGWSGKRIAQELNAQMIPAPGAAWKRNNLARSPKRTDGEWVRTAIIGDVR